MKIYIVCGIVDPNEQGNIYDQLLWTEYFKTRHEAEEAKHIVDDFYSNKCHISCHFEIREIDTKELPSIEQLKEELEDEYNNCWNPDS